MENLNQNLLGLEVYASKAISLEAKKDPNIINLSFGEPKFGPPEHSLQDIEFQDLALASFLDSVKRYEEPRGSLALRQAISAWYKRRYGLNVDPEKEIMITHGGVEAIILALHCTSKTGDLVAITDPTYMLYERAIRTLDRQCCLLKRTPGKYEYQDMLASSAELSQLNQAKAFIINSPENPSGYVLDKSEWAAIVDYSNKTGTWIIHDEVYDTMALERHHTPLINMLPKSDYAIVINSFSKKFGIPGLRIGWMVSNEAVINLATKIHDYLYLGVNIQYEKIATRLISDERNDDWLMQQAKKMQQRAQAAMEVLTEDKGFTWMRKPMGAMFLFPNVRKLYESLPINYQDSNLSVGEAVGKYLMREKKVAVVPGGVYGSQSGEYIRLVLCGSDREFNLALQRLGD